MAEAGGKKGAGFQLFVDIRLAVGTTCKGKRGGQNRMLTWNGVDEERDSERGREGGTEGGRDRERERERERERKKERQKDKDRKTR